MIEKRLVQTLLTLMIAVTSVVSSLATPVVPEFDPPTNAEADSGPFFPVKTPTQETREYLDELRDLIEKGSIHPVIDRHYPLDQVAEAHRYVETGHKKGNVVIDVLE